MFINWFREWEYNGMVYICTMKSQILAGHLGSKLKGFGTDPLALSAFIQS